jgi:ABC-type amino acid transport system permease subunit
MEPINLSSKELILYLAVFGGVVGLVLGLINLLIASKRGKKNLGLIGIPVCIILGVLSPLLAIIAFIVFLVLILRKGGAQQVVRTNEEPVDVSVSESKDS